MFYLVFFDYPLRELVNAGDQLVIHIHLVSKAENAMYRVNLAIKFVNTDTLAIITTLSTIMAA